MSTQKKTYTATYKGKTYTRKTARTYTHAIAVTDIRDGRGEGIVTWCGRLDLALKALDKFSKPAWGFGDLQIVEVHEATK